jgi:hypothetical protein
VTTGPLFVKLALVLEFLLGLSLLWLAATSDLLG